MPSEHQGRRRLDTAAVVAALLVLLSGCGFAGALAHPEAAAGATGDGTAGATGQPAATPTSDPDVVIAQADLLRGTAVSGHLSVTTGAVQTGLVPPVPGFSSHCPVDPVALQYVPVEFAFTDGSDEAVAGLAAHLTVVPGPATPGDIGDVGVFMESSSGDAPYCAGYPPLPSTDTFYNQSGARVITAYVVLDRAVTPATPQGRPDVFPTLQVRIDDLRQSADPSVVHRLAVGSPSVGAACPDDARAICVALG